MFYLTKHQIMLNYSYISYGLLIMLNYYFIKKYALLFSILGLIFVPSWSQKQGLVLLKMSQSTPNSPSSADDEDREECFGEGLLSCSQRFDIQQKTTAHEKLQARLAPFYHQATTAFRTTAYSHPQGIAFFLATIRLLL